MPSGIDTMCVVVHESALEGKKEKLVQRIHELCTPDTVEIHSGLALIATVGRGMVRSKGISARLFNALMKAGDIQPKSAEVVNRRQIKLEKAKNEKK